MAASILADYHEPAVNAVRRHASAAISEHGAALQPMAA